MDTLNSKFKIGDSVSFNPFLNTDELYPLEMPPTGTCGIVKKLTIDQQLFLLWDEVQIAYIVEFDIGVRLVYENDLKLTSHETN